MGRILDLCGEIAASADEGAEGLELPGDVWEKLRADWDDDDIEDAMGLVNDSLMQAELVESADSLSGRLVEILGAFGEEAAFKRAVEGGAVLSLDLIGQLVRRVARLEEILEAYREGSPPDRRGLEDLRRRLMDVGIEEEMQAPEPLSGDEPEPGLPGGRKPRSAGTRGPFTPGAGEGDEEPDEEDEA